MSVAVSTVAPKANTFRIRYARFHLMKHMLVLFWISKEEQLLISYHSVVCKAHWYLLVDLHKAGIIVSILILLKLKSRSYA